jgi:beta-glucosidase
VNGRNGFVWGAATSAFQIEGATRPHGRGEHEDLDLMRSLGLQGYRFSISWPRIQPEGRGPANQKGLDFYRRLVEGLLEREITPLATLYHWDLPQVLQDEGGWASRDVVERFAEYAQIVFGGLGDLVQDWITHNEPWVSAFLGHASGTKAPGATDMRPALRAAHHMLLSHGAAVRVFRAGGYGGRIGITLNLTVARPASTSSDDAAAARRVDGYENRWFLDPVLRGGYPFDMVDLFDARVGPLDAVRPGDLELIAQPLDFLGVNFYAPHVVADGNDDPVLGIREVAADAELTAMDWPIVPSALTDLLLRLERDYGDIPLLITENGAAFDDASNGDAIAGAPIRQAVRDRVRRLRDATASPRRSAPAPRPDRRTIEQRRLTDGLPPRL